MSHSKAVNGTAEANASVRWSSTTESFCVTRSSSVPTDLPNQVRFFTHNPKVLQRYNVFALSSVITASHSTFLRREPKQKQFWF